MNTEEFAHVFLRLACPFLLLTTPIFLYGLFTAPNPPGNELAREWYIFFLLIGIMTIYLSFRYCRNEMGWFGGKKK